MKRIFYPLFFIIFFAFIYLVSVQKTFAAQQLLPAIIKPLQFDPVNPPQDYSPDPFDVTRINESDTRQVDIYFVIQDPQALNKGNYYFCFKGDPRDCNTESGDNLGDSLNDKNDFFGLGADDGTVSRRLIQEGILPNPTTPPDPNAPVIRVRVCGDGENDLKAVGAGADCDPKGNFFHPGSTYRVGLYKKETNDSQDQWNYIGEAVFTVGRFYPNIFSNIQGATPAGPRLLIPSNVAPANDPGAPEITFNDEGFSTFTIPNLPKPAFVKDLSIKLSGVRPGSRNNNYQVKLFGTDVPYSKSYCTTVANDKIEYGTAINEGATSFQGLRPGHYTLYVSEQINEQTRGKTLFSLAAGRGAIFLAPVAAWISAPIALLGAAGSNLIANDPCAADFRYAEIRFHIKRQLDTDGKVTNNLEVIFNKNTMELDPTHTDPVLQGNKAITGVPAPCSFGLDIDGEETDNRGQIIECRKIPIGLGITLSTKPAQFVMELFSYVLSLAGVIAFILLLYSSYRLMTSAGDKQKVAGARETITSAIIGLLFIIFSLLIMQLIGVDFLQIPNLAK